MNVCTSVNVIRGFWGGKNIFCKCQKWGLQNKFFLGDSGNQRSHVHRGHFWAILRNIGNRMNAIAQERLQKMGFLVNVCMLVNLYMRLSAIFCHVEVNVCTSFFGQCSHVHAFGLDQFFEKG